MRNAILGVNLNMPQKLSRDPIPFTKEGQRLDECTDRQRLQET